MKSARILRKLDFFMCLLLVTIHNSYGDFFSDLGKLDIDSKLRALDEVISSLDENNPEPPRKNAKKKTNIGDSLGDAVEALSTLFGDDCNYKCKNGNTPTRKPGHVATSNGCGSHGIQIDVQDLPGMESCCDEHDVCYDTCNKERAACDKQFKTCLNRVCKRIKTFSLSNVSHEDCKIAADLMYSGTVALGCDYYIKAQEKACTCSVPQKSKITKDENNKGSRKFKNDEL